MGSALTPGIVEALRADLSLWGGVLTVTGFTLLVVGGWFVSNRIRERE